MGEMDDALASAIIVVLAVVAVLGAIFGLVYWLGKAKRRSAGSAEAALIKQRARRAFDQDRAYYIYRSGRTPAETEERLQAELRSQVPLFPEDLEVDTVEVEIPPYPEGPTYDGCLKLTFRSTRSVA